MEKPDWNDLRTLAALRRQGSLSGAAAELRLAETTIERRISRLEARLGTAMIDRARGRLRLTRAGEALARPALDAERRFDRALADLAGLDARAEGAVRLSTVPLLANRLLAPALPRLTAAHPDLLLELVAEGRDISLARREADIALRFARPEADAEALTRKIATLPFALYARDPAAIPHFIRYSGDFAGVPVNSWIARNRLPDDADAPLRVSDAETMIAAAQCGQGTALLPRRIGDATGLARLDRPCDLVREVWTVVPRDLRGQARIAAVVDWLAEVFAT